MGPRSRALLFVPIALVQLALPAWMIVGHERILNEGEVFKFKTAPIDPRDPFRGEYVALNFEAESGQWTSPSSGAGYGDGNAFGTLAVDDSGYAVVSTLMLDQPTDGAYLKLMYWSPNDTTVGGITLPFDRYYLEEGDGKKTEDLLAPQWNEDEMIQPLPAYALVRVLDGEAVVEDLVVGDRSIHEWLKNEDVPRP